MKEEPYLRALECPKNKINDIVYFHQGLQKEWLGCFGVMSVIDAGFMANLVEKYGLFQWLQMIFSRNERYVIERVFAVLCCIEDRAACKSLLGDIYETPRTFRFVWDDYVKGEWKKEEAELVKILHDAEKAVKKQAAAEKAALKRLEASVKKHESLLTKREKSGGQLDAEYDKVLAEHERLKEEHEKEKDRHTKLSDAIKSLKSSL